MYCPLYKWARDSHYVKGFSPSISACKVGIPRQLVPKAAIGEATATYQQKHGYLCEASQWEWRLRGERGAGRQWGEDNRLPHRRKIHAEVCTMTAWVRSHGPAQVY